jgi:hypothetical protein
MISSMQKQNLVKVLLVTVSASLALLAGGCASIVHGGNRLMTISSTPSGAKATISKANGEMVSVTTTPCTVSLDPKRGYFKGQSYDLKLELPGYQTAQVELRAEMSGWYWGNLVFGGLIGMLAVDPVTGAMWNIAPNKIDQSLSANQAALIEKREGFVVVLVSDLTAAERTSMVRIN